MKDNWTYSIIKYLANPDIGKNTIQITFSKETTICKHSLSGILSELYQTLP